MRFTGRSLDLLSLPAPPPTFTPNNPQDNLFQPSAFLGFCSQAANVTGKNQIPVPAGSGTVSAGPSVLLGSPFTCPNYLPLMAPQTAVPKPLLFPQASHSSPLFSFSAADLASTQEEVTAAPCPWHNSPNEVGEQ